MVAKRLPFVTWIAAAVLGTVACGGDDNPPNGTGGSSPAGASGKAGSGGGRGGNAGTAGASARAGGSGEGNAGAGEGGGAAGEDGGAGAGGPSGRGGSGTGGGAGSAAAGESGAAGETNGGTGAGEGPRGGGAGTIAGSAGSAVHAGEGGGAGAAQGGNAGAGGSDACTDVTCSGHGVCTLASGRPSCSCEPGYSPTAEDPAVCVADACSGPPLGNCTCVRVAPDGDDALAANDSGQSPFATVAAALAFAEARPDVGAALCIAAGPTCGSTAEFGGSMYVPGGTAVYGRYESSTWTRCEDSETALVPNGTILFLEEDGSNMTLDGLRIEGVVRAEDASNLVLRDVAVTGQVQLGDCTALLENVAIEADCSTSEGLRLGSGSVNVRNADIDACGPGIDASELELLRLEGVRIRSGATGVQLLQSFAEIPSCVLDVSGVSAIGISQNDCNDASLHVSDTSIAVRGQVSAEGIHHEGAAPCDVLVTGTTVSVTSEATALGIQCRTSGCRLEENTIRVSGAATSGSATGTGVLCSGCSVSNNHVSLFPPPLLCYDGCSHSGSAIELLGGVADGNVVDLGCSFDGIGIRAWGGLLQNNMLRGRSCPPSPLLGRSFYGIVTEGPEALVARSNTIMGGILQRGAVTASYYQNVIRGGPQFLMDDAMTTPWSVALNANLLDSSTTAGIYRRSNGYVAQTQEDANRFIGASGNIIADPEFLAPPLDLHIGASSPAIDAFAAGEVTVDFEGDTRSGLVDLGADEFSNVTPTCGASNCNGLGFCWQRPSGAECVCNPGARHPSNDPLACETVPASP